MSNPLVLLETTAGEFLLELFPDRAPLTVENFLRYVDSGFYNGTIFHRVIRDFMIQGGGYTLRLEEKKSRAPIRNEAGNKLSNKRGSLAMARTSDPHSATAQFFINHADNPELDFREENEAGWGYCVFGHILEGLETLDKICRIKVKAIGEHEAMPVDSVLITSAARFE